MQNNEENDSVFLSEEEAHNKTGIRGGSVI